MKYWRWNCRKSCICFEQLGLGKGFWPSENAERTSASPNHHWLLSHRCPVAHSTWYLQIQGSGWGVHNYSWTSVPPSVKSFFLSTLYPLDLLWESQPSPTLSGIQNAPFVSLPMEWCSWLAPVDGTLLLWYQYWVRGPYKEAGEERGMAAV